MSRDKGAELELIRNLQHLRREHNEIAGMHNCYCEFCCQAVNIVKEILRSEEA